MKRPDRITAGFSAIVLAAVVVVGGVSASATGGDQTDPLITLSYLTQVVTPELMAKVDEQIAANEQTLTDKLDAAIEDYSEQMDQVLAENVGESASYTVVSIAAGQTLKPEAGVELLLRSGGAKVSGGASPVLLDATAGNSLEIGGALQANHLYVAPLEGAAITVLADASFLVRGAYSIT